MTRHSADALRTDHAVHDQESIAAYAASDAAGADRARAEAQVRDCEDCARLLADLRAIATATRTLPPPFAISRDFRLSPADAARLHGGRWRRLVGLGGRTPATRPFAAAFMTLGIVGLLIATVPFMSLMGSAGAAPMANPASSHAAGASTDTPKSVTEATNGDLAAQSAAAAGSPAAAPGSSLAAPLATGAGADNGGARESQNPAYFISPAPTEDLTFVPAPDDVTPAAPSSPLVPLSLAFIAVGIGFFALGRRSARGP
jgi:hypothetical protein